MADVIAIIPARGNSKRLPRKNIKLFCGEPIIAYPIRAAQESGIFNEIIVSSEDHEILNISHHHGAHAIERPAHISQDHVVEAAVYSSVLNELPQLPDYFCGIYPTAAFLKGYNLKESLKVMLDNNANGCMGVHKFNHHPYQTMTRGADGFLNLDFPEKNELPRYPDAYASNGSLYWLETIAWLKTGSVYTSRLVPYEVFNKDINTEQDFKDAETMYEVMKCRGG